MAGCCMYPLYRAINPSCRQKYSRQHVNTVTRRICKRSIANFSIQRSFIRASNKRAVTSALLQLCHKPRYSIYVIGRGWSTRKSSPELSIETDQNRDGGSLEYLTWAQAIIAESQLSNLGRKLVMKASAYRLELAAL